MTSRAATPADTTALITGATAGIGAEFARQLAEQGHNVVLVARDATRLQAKAEELEKRYGIRAEVLAADLADDGGVAAVVERLTDPARPVEILVNNAGIGLLRSFAENDIAEETRHLKLHVETAMQLTHAALQGMLGRHSGRIINVASVAAFLPRGSYSAAKSWLVSFSRGANLAYAKQGVTVTAVCPGFTHTEFHDRMGMDKTATPRWMWLQAERVVREGLADNAQGRAVSIPTKRYKVLTAAARVLPDRLVAGPPRRARVGARPRCRRNRPTASGRFVGDPHGQQAGGQPIQGVQADVHQPRHQRQPLAQGVPVDVQRLADPGWLGVVLQVGPERRQEPAVVGPVVVQERRQQILRRGMGAAAGGRQHQGLDAHRGCDGGHARPAAPAVGHG